MGPTYQVVLSKGAQQDLLTIYDYLFENVSYETAEYVKAGLEAEIEALAQAPSSRGLLRGHKSTVAYRRVLKWSYRIIFSIEENQLMVEVVTIDSTRMNPSKLEDLP